MAMLMEAACSLHLRDSILAESVDDWRWGSRSNRETPALVRQAAASHTLLFLQSELLKPGACFSALPLLSAFNQGGVGGVLGNKTVNYIHNVRFMSIQAETAWMATDNQTRHSLKPVWLKACVIFFLTNILNLQKLNKFAVLKQMYIQQSPGLEVSTLFRVKWNMEYWIIGIIGEGWAGEKFRFSRSSIAGFMCRC